MTVRRQLALLQWVALAVLLCIVGVIVEENLVHTDDGCAVEVHCAVCRWAYCSTGVVADVPAPTLLLEWVDNVVAAQPLAAVEPSTDVPASRGPPTPRFLHV